MSPCFHRIAARTSVIGASTVETGAGNGSARGSAVRAWSGSRERSWTIWGRERGSVNGENGSPFFCTTLAYRLTMRARGSLLAALVVTVALALVAVPVLGAVGAPAPATDAAPAQTTDENETDRNGTEGLGARIGAFMQANSADTESAVEEGMWQARYNATGEAERADLVSARVDRLDRRGDRLRDRMAALQARYESGEIPRVAYVAQASRLAEELNALDESVNRTEDRARAVGVNTSRLDAIRDRAREMRGQEVAAVARNLSVVRPGNAGPPGDVGPPGDAEDRPDGPDVTGPPRNVTDGSDRGPPGDRGRDGDLPIGDDSDANVTDGNGSSPLDSGLDEGDRLGGADSDGNDRIDDSDGRDSTDDSDLTDGTDVLDGADSDGTDGSGDDGLLGGQ